MPQEICILKRHGSKTRTIAINFDILFGIYLTEVAEWGGGGQWPPHFFEHDLPLTKLQGKDL